MPLLFYGSLEGKRALYSKELKPIETSVFDIYEVKHLSPYRLAADVGNLWWFPDRNHTAISWNECRIDLTQPRGITANETKEFREQTIFIPGLLGHLEAIEIMRTQFPDYLVPGAIVFRFHNEGAPYLYHD